jgi:hypothetical protein
MISPPFNLRRGTRDSDQSQCTNVPKATENSAREEGDSGWPLRQQLELLAFRVPPALLEALWEAPDCLARPD